MKNLILLLILIIFVQMTLAAKTDVFSAGKKCKNPGGKCKKNKDCCSGLCYRRMNVCQRRTPKKH